MPPSRYPGRWRSDWRQFMTCSSASERKQEQLRRQRCLPRQREMRWVPGADLKRMMDVTKLPGDSVNLKGSLAAIPAAHAQGDREFLSACGGRGECGTSRCRRKLP